MIKELNPVELNAIAPIDVNPFPKFAEVRELTELKAPLPIVLTLFGIVIDVILVPEKTQLAIAVTPSGIIAVPAQLDCPLTTLFTILK